MSVRTKLAARLLGLDAEVAKAVAAQAEADAWAEFRRELERSRRYERRFVLVAFSLRAGENGRRTPGLGAASAVPLVRSLLRSVDHAWASGDLIYVLLPEADRRTAEAFLARLRAHEPALVGLDDARVAAFPEDGVTSGALLAKLQGKPIEGTPRDVAATSARRVAAPDAGTIAT